MVDEMVNEYTYPFTVCGGCESVHNTSEMFECDFCEDVYCTFCFELVHQDCLDRRLDIED